MPGGLGIPHLISVTARARLVGDGLENPANARALMDAAAMFGVPCVFRDTRGLLDRWSPRDGDDALPTVATAELLSQLLPIIAVENSPGAEPLFGSALPAGTPSIVVGNERHGIRGDVLRSAARCLEIPMPGRGMNTLNVASAAAVALYYLIGPHRHPMRQAARPQERRPAVLLVGPRDHVEAGSALRSAAAFGWRTIGLDDRHHVWFGVPRAMVAEGRAASRAHRNAIRVMAMRTEASRGFRRVVVVGTRFDGPPLHRVELAGGRDTLIVIPDGEQDDPLGWGYLGSRVDLARIDTPVDRDPSRYRLTASIVLAEASRQIGHRPAGRPPLPERKAVTYESALETVAVAAADVVAPETLRAY
jgi:tRNA G18 (ribose-2'-O)-methylase SpoU